MCFDGRKPEADALMRAVGAAKAGAEGLGPGTPADACRANGWGVGDVLEYESCGGTRCRLRVTAVGEGRVLARWLRADGSEHDLESGVWPGLLERASKVG
jgi:hypothetical protein